MQITKSIPIIIALFSIVGVGYVSSIDTAEAIVQKDGIRIAFCENMAWTFAECTEKYDGYTWTDRFTVLIGASGFNEDSTKIDVIGGGSDDPIHVYSQYDRIPVDQDVVFMETGLNTGIFMGNIKMTGQTYDADGDGSNDMMRMTKGNVYCNETKPSGGMSMFIFGMPFLSDIFSLTTQLFLPNAEAADYTRGGHPDVEKSCVSNMMKKEELVIVSSYDYAAKIKTEKQNGAVTVSFQYQEDPDLKTIQATAHHNWRLGEINFDKDAYYVGEPVTFYLRDADLWTMHHGQPAEYDVVEIWSTSDLAGVESPVQFVMNHDHGDKNQRPDSAQLDPHAGHKEGALFHAPPTALTQIDSSNQWKVYLWWEPGGVFEANTDYGLNIMFHDKNNDIMQENVAYSIQVTHDGEILNHLSDTNQFTSSGHILEKFNFKERGTVTVKLYDINLNDSETSFIFQVAPNSGNMFDIVKHSAYDTVWNDPRWEGYMHQHFVDLLPGRIYTEDLENDNVNVVKFKREVIGVTAGDQLCVKYNDRTQPEILPDGTPGKTDENSEYHITKCVDILGLAQMSDTRSPTFN